jgi:hypothetical protein
MGQIFKNWIQKSSATPVVILEQNRKFKQLLKNPSI